MMHPRMDSASWYGQIYRKLHLDWHQPPWIKNPGGAINRKTAREQARMFKRAGIEAVEIFVYDHHGQALFPSKAGVRHPNVKVDYPGLMLEALRAEGLKTIGYMNGLTSIHLFKRRPDWFVRLPDGTYPNNTWLTYPRVWLCLASPYGNEYFLPLVAEVLTRYPFDGLWLDALSWMVDTLCHCDSCRQRFRRATGCAPPAQAPADLERCSAKERALWFAWKTYRLGLVNEFHQKIFALAHRIRPGIVVVDNNAGLAVRPLVETRADRFQGWLSSSELAVDAFSCDPVAYGGNHAALLSFHGRHQATTDKPFDYMNERFHCWGEWQTRSPTDWRLEFATILANGGRCFFADQPYADGSLEPEVYRQLKPCYDFVKLREPLCRDAAPVYEIGILSSAAAYHFGLPILHDPKGYTPKAGAQDRIGGAHLAAIELGWQAHIFDEAGLRRELPNLRLVILPDQELLEDATIEALRGWVRAGGKLLLAGGCGRFNDRFEPRARWPFAEMAGVTFLGEWPAPVNYFRPSHSLVAKGKELLDLPVQCWGRAIRFRTKTARGLATLSEPLPDAWSRRGGDKRSRDHFQHHTVTGACPPARATAGDSIFLNRCGEGQVMTLAVDPFARYSVEGHRLLRGLIEACVNTLYPPSQRGLFFIDKPLHMETHLMRQRDRLVLHCLNYFAQKRKGNMVCNEELTPSRPFTVRLRPSARIQSLRGTGACGRLAAITIEPEGIPLKARQTGAALEVRLPSIEIHSAIVFRETTA